MNKGTGLGIAMALLASSSQAAESKLNLPLDYGLIRTALIQQLYTGEGGSARLWKDGKECSFLDLTDPRISGDNGQIKILNTIHARIGIRLSGKCIPAMEWRGDLQTLQKPTVAANGNQLSFPVTAIDAFDQNGTGLNIGELEQLIHKAVEPKLAELKIDLNEVRPDIQKNLARLVGAGQQAALEELVNSLHFKQVVADDKALQVGVIFKTLKPVKKAEVAEAAFSPEELQQWQSLWLGLEMTLDNSISKPPLEQQSEQVKLLLRETLQEAGQAFEQGLTQTVSKAEDDPVRIFFKQSWDKLAPLLRKASTNLPAADSLRYLTLIAATDMIYELDNIGSALGLEVSSQGLRKIARSYLQQPVAADKPANDA